MKTPPELDRIVDVVLAHRPSEKEPRKKCEQCGDRGEHAVHGRVGEGILHYTPCMRCPAGRKFRLAVAHARVSLAAGATQREIRELHGGAVLKAAKRG